jgi:hypothetical protein
MEALGAVISIVVVIGLFAAANCISTPRRHHKSHPRSHKSRARGRAKSWGDVVELEELK